MLVASCAERVSFHPKVERFRLMSSNIQLIANELALRKAGVQVIFEPGIQAFEYGAPVITAYATSVSNRGASAFRARGPSSEARNAPEGVREEFEKQDELLDLVGDHLLLVKDQAMATQDEVIRSTAQIGRINGQMDKTSAHMNRTTNKVIQLT